MNGGKLGYIWIVVMNKYIEIWLEYAVYILALVLRIEIRYSIDVIGI